VLGGVEINSHTFDYRAIIFSSFSRSYPYHFVLRVGSSWVIDFQGLLYKKGSQG
jgi:hypothetical protein